MKERLPSVLVATTGNIIEKFTRGDDLIKIERSGDEQSQNGDFYYYYDGLGSVRTITKTDGTVICRYVYDVYGKPLASETNEQQTWNVFKFTGEYYDDDVELLYLRARWYDPATGRFLTRDTYEGDFDEPLSLHRYGYCHEDPVNNEDPSGEDASAATLPGMLTAQEMRAILVGMVGAVIIQALIKSEGQIVDTFVNACVDIYTLVATSVSATAAAEAALKLHQMTKEELAQSARDILKETGRFIKRVLKNLKVVPISKSIMPNIADNIEKAQSLRWPVWLPLMRCDPSRARSNRRDAIRFAKKYYGVKTAKKGYSLDEYPFASTYQGGAGSRVVAVPAKENWIQGGYVSLFYRWEKITPGTDFWVVVVP